MQIVNQRQAELRRNGEYWEQVRRENHRGGGHPPIVYDFCPPFLFDCRLKCERRMGVGDQLCLVSAIQMVADKVGGHNVLVAYDPTYPGSADVFGMAGLPITTDPAGAPPGVALIPCRGHIMECPLNTDRPCLYGEAQGNPIAQILYNWGWHGLFAGHPVRLRLTPSNAAVARAGGIIAGITGGVVTCTPLEISRGNRDCSVDAWRVSLLKHCNHKNTILFGCSKADAQRLQAMVQAMRLPHVTQIVTEPLPVWKALIDLSDASFTGNSCGMWLAIGSQTRTCVLQHTDPNHAHNLMWDIKSHWNCRNVEIINV